jgi:murein L,D-transpeptidase YafK
LNRRAAFVRALLASAAIAGAMALASCETDGNVDMTRAMKPLSPEMTALLEQKHMPKQSPILVRIFKEEAEMEVWKQDETGRYDLLKTYPICRWSGELGPKVREGDRQAPEGFYTITPGQMNPNSNYYLSFNLGFPNTFDKANDRTGAFLMVHGDCSSAGCYAMTDDQMGEIYALGREAFFGGQRAFQVQAYPFHMTPTNLARHRNNPNLAFWRMIKQGNDLFEVTRQEPKIDVCDKHYVFDAEPPPGSTAPLSFNPKGRCPAYVLPEDVAAALKEKQDTDEREFANLASHGAPTVAVRTGTDGGTNPVFAAQLKPDTVDRDGRMRGQAPAEPQTAAVAPPNSAGGSDAAGKPVFSTASSESRPAPAPDTTGSSNANNPLAQMTSTVSKWVGLPSQNPTPNPDPPPADPQQAAPVPKPKANAVQTAAIPRQAQQHSPIHAAQPTTEKPRDQMADVQQSAPPPPARSSAPAAWPEPAAPSAPTRSAAAAPSPPEQPASAPSGSTQTAISAPTGVMSGAQPTMPSSSFNSRWGGVQ